MRSRSIRLFVAFACAGLVSAAAIDPAFLGVNPALLGHDLAPPVDPGQAEPLGRSRRAPRDRHDFELRGISVVEGGDAGGSPSLRAESIVGRRRTGGGGLLFYRDVEEFVAVDVDIRLRALRRGETLLGSVYDGVRRSFSLGSGPFSADVGRSGAAASLTRVLFEKLSVRVQSAGQKDLSIASNRARMNFDLDTLVLDGRVVLRTPRGEETRASRAVFSRRLDGVYLPAGCAIGDTRFDGGTVLALDGSGALSASRSDPDIATEDYLERQERLLLARLAKAAPPALRFQLPLLLDGLHSFLQFEHGEGRQ